jgi:predicted nucleic acid-binding protein
MMVDTQIISRSFKKSDDECQDARICSVVANEFLESYFDSAAKPRYFIPLPARLAIKGVTDWRFPRDRPPPQARLVDRIIIDFDNEFSSIIDHSSQAVSEVINHRNEAVYRWAISGLHRSEQKRLHKRFTFLCETVAECVPLNKPSVRMAIILLSEFLKKHVIKQRFRNSFNDMLILAVAIAHRDDLQTEDSLSARFAAVRHGAVAKMEQDDLIIDFSSRVKAPKRRSSESKVRLETSRGRPGNVAARMARWVAMASRSSTP